VSPVVNRALRQVRRFYAPERADVTLRDYQFVRPHVPDPSRAQASYQWDFAVVVTSLELVMTQVVPDLAACPMSAG